MPYDVFFYEAFAEEAPAIAAALPTRVRAGFTSETIQASQHSSPPAPLISIRTQSSVPEKWLTSLRGVLARTTGYDHLLPLQRSGGPALACLDEYCSRAVAEQAALLWMALLRKLPLQISQFVRFDRDGLTGGECAGRTLSIFGVGRIGYEISRIGKGLAMRVIGVDPVQRHPDVEYLDPAAALAVADVVVCSMNLTPSNHNYFSARLLKSCRQGALFINVARGELAPVSDLRAALDAGTLGGLGLDVFEDEPTLADALRRGSRSPLNEEAGQLRALAARPNVILTPHNAFNTREAVERKACQSADEVIRFLEHGQFSRPLHTGAP